MSANEIARIGKWDELSLERALRHADPEDVNALQILKHLFHHDPNKRYSTLREALEHPFFSGSSDDRILKKKDGTDTRPLFSNYHPSKSPRQKYTQRPSVKNRISEGQKNGISNFIDQENSANGVPRRMKGCDESILSGKSRCSIMGLKFNPKMKGLRERMKGRGQI